jgi:hypothetical protein
MAVVASHGGYGSNVGWRSLPGKTLKCISSSQAHESRHETRNSRANLGTQARELRRGDEDTNHYTNTTFCFLVFWFFQFTAITIQNENDHNFITASPPRSTFTAAPARPPF